MITKYVLRFLALASLALLGAIAAKASVNEFNYYDTTAYISWQETVTTQEYRGGILFSEDTDFSFGDAYLAPNEECNRIDSEQPDAEYTLTYGFSGTIVYTSCDMIDFYPL